MNKHKNFKYTGNDAADLLIYTYAQTYSKYEKIAPENGTHAMERTISAFENAKSNLQSAAHYFPSSSKTGSEVVHLFNLLDAKLDNLRDSLEEDKIKERTLLEKKLTSLNIKLQNFGVHFNDLRIIFNYSSTNSPESGSLLKESILDVISKNNTELERPDIDFDDFKGTLSIDLPHGCKASEAIFDILKGQNYQTERTFPNYEINNQYLSDIEAIGDNSIYQALCGELIMDRPDLGKRYNKTVNKEKAKMQTQENEI